MTDQAQSVQAPRSLLQAWQSLKIVSSMLQRSFVQSDVGGYNLESLVNQACAEMTSTRFQVAGALDQAVDYGTQKAVETVVKLLVRSNLVAQLLTGASDLGHGCVWDPALTNAVEQLMSQHRAAFADNTTLTISAGGEWFAFYGGTAQIIRRDGGRPGRMEQFMEAGLASQQIALELGYWINDCKARVARKLPISITRINERCSAFEQALGRWIQAFATPR